MRQRASQDKLNKLKETLIPYLLLVAMIGNSSYLSYKYIQFYYMGGYLTLDCADDCDAVMTSSYALIAGIPTPTLGLVFFVVLMFSFLFLEYNKRFFQFLLVVGCLAACTYLYILYEVLEMSCKFCISSHIMLFAFTIYYLKFLRK